MKSLNISILSQMNDPHVFSEYESALSGRIELKITKDYEQESLRNLVNFLSLPLSLYDGFFFSYKINHIGKEFDLLKIADDKSQILNIELKSQPIELEKIEKQLIQNQYYLNVVSNSIYSFTYIASTNIIYYLDSTHKLVETDISHLRRTVRAFDTPYIKEDVDSLFKSSDFLISPINTPQKFLSNNYFLTNQQETIKNTILQIDTSLSAHFISITGGPGTGKTLLLYDIAKALTTYGPVCIIHCGMLSEGHTFLNLHLKNITIKAIRDINSNTSFSNYAFILIDETQRIYKSQFDIIVAAVKTLKLTCIFSYDQQQILATSEEHRNISTEIALLTSMSYKLSEKIRTNKELSTFILALLDLKRKTNLYTYNCVDILYAQSEEDANNIINLYKKNNYTFINFTSSRYYPTSFDVYGNDLNTHEVIGQEFENVLMVLNNNFYYDTDQKLKAYAHPHNDYLYRKLFFQGLSRTREKLCLIIVKDLNLFKTINSIKTRA